MSQDDVSDKRGIQSVDAAVEILNAVAAANGPQPLSAIARATGNAVSTTHRHLVSLQRGHLVQQDSTTGGYDLGPAALKLGVAALRRMDALGVALVHGAKVAQDTGATTFISTWTDAGPLVVRWFPGDHPLITSTGVGSVLPLMTSSAGRVFAAYLPPHLVEKLVGRSTVTEASKGSNSLKDIRKSGCAWSDGLYVTGLRGISVPVLDFQGHIQCALTVLGADPRLVKLPNPVQASLMAAGRAASAQLGYAAQA